MPGVRRCSEADKRWNEVPIREGLILAHPHRYIPVYREGRECWPLPMVTLSPHDRSREVLLAEEGAAVCRTPSPLGYRSAMGTHGVAQGRWYFEVLVEEEAGGDGATGHVRVGVAGLQAHLGGPVGMDTSGYGFCDTGHRVHNAYKYPYGRAAPVGSVIGVLLTLPPTRQTVPYRSRQFFTHGPNKGMMFMQCELDKIDPEKSIEGSSISFYLNGEALGPAYTNLVDLPLYFPIISVYGRAIATVNFGPEFCCPPDISSSEFTPWSAAYRQQAILSSLLSING